MKLKSLLIACATLPVLAFASSANAATTCDVRAVTTSIDNEFYLSLRNCNTRVRYAYVKNLPNHIVSQFTMMASDAVANGKKIQIAGYTDRDSDEVYFFHTIEALSIINEIP